MGGRGWTEAGEASTESRPIRTLRLNLYFSNSSCKNCHVIVSVSDFRMDGLKAGKDYPGDTGS